MNTHTNVLAVEDADSIENNKKFVTHDLCICFYELAFKSKRLPKEKLAGPPSTRPVVLNIFNAIKEYSDIKKIKVFTAKERYSHHLDHIHISDDKSYIECVFACLDKEAEDLRKYNELKDEESVINFNQNESHIKRTHVLIQLTEDKTKANLFFEANRGTALGAIRELFNFILDTIRLKATNPELFEEIYVGSSDEIMNFSIVTSIDPIEDKDIVDRIKNGDFLRVEITKTNELKFHEELSNLYESKQSFELKPSFSQKESLAKFSEGLKKFTDKHVLGKKTQEKVKISHKLVFRQGDHERKVELDILNESISTIAVKKHWIDNFERHSLPKDIKFDSNVFDTLKRISKQKNSS